MKINILGVEMEASDKVLYASPETSREYINAMKNNWKEELVSLLAPNYPLNELSYKLLIDKVESILAEQKKELMEEILKKYRLEIEKDYFYTKDDRFDILMSIINHHD